MKIDWKTLVMQIAMITLATNPATAPLAPIVATAINQTEDLLKKIPGETKAERNKRKLDNAAKLAQEALAGVNVVKPGKVDTVLTDALIKDSISTIVDATNLLHKSQAVQLAAKTEHEQAVEGLQK